MPELGLTAPSAQAQLTMWAVVAARLVIGADVRALSPASIAMLSDPEVIAVDQDPLGIQGTLTKRDETAEVWVKPLAGADRAVAILNRGSTTRQIEADASDLGLAADSSFQVRDLWAKVDTDRAGPIVAEVLPHAAVLFRLAPTA